MNTRPVFHGSDIEKICEYYHLDKKDIINFGANVNPLGLSENVKDAISAHRTCSLPIRTESMPH